MKIKMTQNESMIFGERIVAGGRDLTLREGEQRSGMGAVSIQSPIDLIFFLFASDRRERMGFSFVNATN